MSTRPTLAVSPRRPGATRMRVACMCSRRSLYLLSARRPALGSGPGPNPVGSLLQPLAAACPGLRHLQGGHALLVCLRVGDACACVCGLGEGGRSGGRHQQVIGRSGGQRNMPSPTQLVSGDPQSSSQAPLSPPGLRPPRGLPLPPQETPTQARAHGCTAEAAHSRSTPYRTHAQHTTPAAPAPAWRTAAGGG